MPKLWEALVTMLILVGALALGIVKYETDPHVPMFIGVMGAALMALYLGYKWEAIEKSMMDGIYKALQSVCILVIVGILIGVWINAGVVPTMIFYGLKVLKPAIFFIASVLICSITSLATGTSWGTMGTMGVALMGIGFGLGMSPGMTAGAVLSGAYFGDKMSPLSDTTNLAPAMAGTDVMTHVKAMILPTGITYVITLIGFGILGAMQYHGGDADMSRVTEFSGALEAVFNINPALLLPPVIVIVAVAMKMPAIPGITLGIISGAIMGMIFQPECNMGTVFDFGMNGYYFSDEVLAMFEETLSPETSYTMTRLLESGGILGMMSSVATPTSSRSLSTASRSWRRAPRVSCSSPSAPACSPTPSCPSSTSPSSFPAVCMPRNTERRVCTRLSSPVRWKAPVPSPPPSFRGTPAACLSPAPSTSTRGARAATARGLCSTG